MAKQMVLNRKMYKEIKKMDHQDMSNYLSRYYMNAGRRGRVEGRRTERSSSDGKRDWASKDGKHCGGGREGSFRESKALKLLKIHGWILRKEC